MYNTWYIKKRIGLGLMVILSFFSSISFAQNDCEYFSDEVSLALSNDSFLSAKDLAIARNHLRSFCCLEYPKLSALTGKCDNLVLGPESPYRYDHLVDVGLRKLDAESMYPGMVADPQGNEWREAVKDPEKKKTPEEFSTLYTKYWTLSSPYLFLTYGDDYLKFNQDGGLKTLSQFNLHDKYINYCFVAMMMYYQLVPDNHMDVVADGYYGRCLAMVKSRIRQETSFAIMVSQYHAANLLVDSWSSYTKQFVQNRLMKLLDKLVAISSLFNTFAKQAPLSDACQK